MPSRHSRRSFLAASASSAALAAIAGAPELAAQVAMARPAPPDAAQDPDLVVVNARVHTMDPRLPRAEAFAVTAGRFTAVGRSAEIRALAGRRTRVVDAKGMAVVPGFIDTHNHGRGEVLLYEVLVGNPFEVEMVSIASIVAKLRDRARQLPPGTWVEGYFHDDTKLTDRRPLGYALLVLAPLLIVAVLWFWVDLNEELADLPPWRALPLTVRIWRWSLTLLSLPAAAFASTALACMGGQGRLPFCPVWLEAPQGLHGLVARLFGFVFGGQWTPAVAAFVGYVALAAYAVGLLQWLLLRLPRQGRVAGGF